MNEDVVDAAYTESGTAVAVREEPMASPALFGTSDPVEVVQKAVRVADALKSVVVAKKLVANIQGKEYPQVEAWLTLAAMLRLTTICEWSRPVQDGWEARVIVRDANGNTIGAAEAQCLGTERSKKGWEQYALRSMAQTRATSKALRSVLSFIMVLAGFQATPAEEMPGDTTPPATPKPAAQTKAQELCARWTALGDGRDEAAFRAEFAGKTVSEIRAAVEAAETDVAAGAIRRPASPIPDTATPSGTEAVREREPAAASGGGETADEVHRARLIKRLMALHGEVGDKTPRQRHERYARVVQKISSKDMDADEIVAVIHDIEFTLAHNEGKLL